MLSLYLPEILLNPRTNWRTNIELQIIKNYKVFEWLSFVDLSDSPA